MAVQLVLAAPAGSRAQETRASVAGHDAPRTINPYARGRIIVGLPSARKDQGGELRLSPSVHVSEAAREPHLADPQTDSFHGGDIRQATRLAPVGDFGPPESLPAPAGSPELSDGLLSPGQFEFGGETAYSNGGTVDPIFEGIVGDYQGGGCASCGSCGGKCQCGSLAKLFAYGMPYSPDAGVGRERVKFATFAIEHSQPMNNYTFQLDRVQDFVHPDRAEYLFARPSSFPGGKGPALIEGNVDYRDLRFRIETATGPQFSTTFDIPIRILDPEVNGNTSGLGDVGLTTRLVLLDGECWQITQMTKTFFQSGNPAKGWETGTFRSNRASYCGSNGMTSRIATP